MILYLTVVLSITPYEDFLSQNGKLVLTDINPVRLISLLSFLARLLSDRMYLFITLQAITNVAGNQAALQYYNVQDQSQFWTFNTPPFV